MAGDIAGMFGQLNSAIQGGNQAEQGQGYVDSMSQGFGNVAAGGMNMMRPQGDSQGQPFDPYSFMNEGGAQQQGQQDLAKLNLQTAQGMGQAAKIYQSMGEPEKGVQAATLAKTMGEAEVKQIKEHGQTAALLDLIKNDSTITKEEREYYNAAATNGSLKTRSDYLTAKRGGTGDSHISSTGKMVRDSKGSLYNTVVTTDKNTLVPTTQYSLVGEGTEDPVGRVTPISTTTGLDGADTQANRLELAQTQSNLRMSEAELDNALTTGRMTRQQVLDIKKAQAVNQLDQEDKWQTDRNEIVMNIPGVLTARNAANKALVQLDTTSTSGIIASIEKIKDVIGVGDTSNIAELNNAMSTYVLENLKKMGANPTEGERAFLIESGANIARGTEANVALFEKTLRRINMNAAASEFLLDNPAATRDEYVKKYNEIIQQELGTTRIKLGDRAKR